MEALSFPANIATVKKQLNELYDTAYVNINGEICRPQDAMISIFDRGFLYGDSIYEVTYSEKGCLLFFEEHLDRLFNSAELLNMHIFLSREEIISEALKTLKASKLERAYIRIIITRGETAITLDPNSSFKNNFVIIVKPQPEYPIEMYEKGIKLFIASVQRNDVKAVNPNAKSGNYLNNVMAISEAKDKGYDDAIMVNKNGDITEGTTFNIWMVSKGVIYTPPKESGLLKGITRAKVIELCRKHNLELKVEAFGTNDILNADEIFITSSTKGIMAVSKINDHITGESLKDWPMIQKLSTLYKQRAEEEINTAKYFYL